MYNPAKHKRKSIRLKGYDYSQPGMYFITVAVKNRKCVLGKIVNNEMILSELGKIVQSEWLNIPTRFTNVQLDEFIVMPNHFHGIINVGATLAVAQNDNVVTQNDMNRNKTGASPAPTLGDFVGAFKSLTVNHWLEFINENNLDISCKFWQRNYYEEIIRNEVALKNIRQYIRNNPLKWNEDRNNPDSKLIK